ncbi:MAG: hypothetical protein IJ009_01300 [Clostridia bacterium]|nr:hypothetical protein [Clostridia bacterium]
MKKYISPDVELLALYAKDAIMASGEKGPNETDLDEFMNDLTIDEIQTI